MPQKEKSSAKVFDPGELIFSWVAHDYHTHRRGLIWYIVFCTFVFGSALYFLLFEKGGAITAFSLFFAAAVYFWAHRKGDEDHEIFLLERGLLIDKKNFFSWDQFVGYWLLYDETVSIVHFEFKEKKGKSIALQMGQTDPDELQKMLSLVELEFLEDRKESLLDLWIRGLKL